MCDIECGDIPKMQIIIIDGFPSSCLLVEDESFGNASQSDPSENTRTTMSLLDEKTVRIGGGNVQMWISLSVLNAKYDLSDERANALIVDLDGIKILTRECKMYKRKVGYFPPWCQSMRDFPSEEKVMWKGCMKLSPVLKDNSLSKMKSPSIASKSERENRDRVNFGDERLQFLSTIACSSVPIPSI